ncbi:MAG: SPOR domain-containing protein [Colwellia sp.]
MTALIKSKPPTLFNKTLSEALNSTVTEISVISRIDYVLRFSKHLVAVINDNNSINTLAGEFIESVSDKTEQQTNTAFLYASTQLNDIQLRCRLIEQLFGSCMFDPEQSLAHSILQLAKKFTSNICIVIEDAQWLSTSMMVELSHLALQAKQKSIPLDIVVFGDKGLASNLGANKETFAKKLTIISSSNGQILNVKKLGREGIFQNIALQHKGKLAAIVVIITILTSLTWLGIDQYKILPFLNEALQTYAKEQNSNTQSTIEVKPVINLNSANTKPLADVTEIYGVIAGGNTPLNTPLNKSANDKNPDQVKQFASASEISQQLILAPGNAEPPENDVTPGNIELASIAQSAVEQKSVEQITGKQQTIVGQEQTETLVNTPEETASNDIAVNIEPLTNNNQKIKSTGHYYDNIKEGNAVQLVSFNNEQALNNFIGRYPELELYSFTKNVRGNEYHVVTSKVFATVTEANNFIGALPQSMSSTKPWVIPIKMINEHRQAF